MKYRKAQDVLPEEIVRLLQDYISGDYLYVPRKEGEKKSWGEKSGSRDVLKSRNKEIYNKYSSGCPVVKLSEDYFLSEQSIRRIICQVRKYA